MLVKAHCKITGETLVYEVKPDEMVRVEYSETSSYKWLEEKYKNDQSELYGTCTKFGFDMGDNSDGITMRVVEIEKSNGNHHWIFVEGDSRVYIMNNDGKTIDSF